MVEPGSASAAGLDASLGDNVMSQLLPLDAAAAAAGGIGNAQLDDLGRFVEPIVSDGALPAKVKLFALYLIGTIHGHDELRARAMSRALQAGLTRDELIDGLMAGVLSRGISVLLRSLECFDHFPALEGAPDGANDERRASREEMLEYFAGVYGELPAWVAAMTAAAPDYFEAYYHHRARVIADGPFLRKHKELMIVAINAVDRYPFGVEHHLKGAFEGGGTSQEAIEAMLVAIAAGGMPAFLEAYQVLERLTEHPAAT